MAKKNKDSGAKAKRRRTDTNCGGTEKQAGAEAWMGTAETRMGTAETRTGAEEKPLRGAKKRTGAKKSRDGGTAETQREPTRTSAVFAQGAAYTGVGVRAGRVSRAGDGVTHAGGWMRRTRNDLENLRRQTSVYDAVDYIARHHPDARMAVTIMLRLAGGGGNMEFKGAGRASKRLAEEWRAVCTRLNRASGGGLDGLMNGIHRSLLLYDGMGVEIVVNEECSDLEDCYFVLPKSIEWQLEDSVWTPYQYHDGKRWRLSDGNFIWAALDPDVGKPTGAPQFEAALGPIERQWQYMDDAAAVLRRMGYPRNDISINREAAIASLSPAQNATAESRSKALDEIYDGVSAGMQALEPTDDFLHFDDVSIQPATKDNARSIDLRAYNELVDPQVLNGLGCLGVLLNRTTGVTETWGTVQFKIVAETVKSMQQISKRVAESIANTWLRCKGIAAQAVYTPNVVDVESELQKIELRLRTQEFHRKAEEYGWERGNAAAAAFGMDGDGQMVMTQYCTHDTPQPDETDEGGQGF